ncbi:MAG: metallophosphoesterase [Chlamydiota bacterium]
MTIWALSDLHLAFSTPEKTMEVFGKRWENYAKRIEDHWNSNVAATDLVLIPGDISWAMHLEAALIDLKWIDALPGEKVILKGNHDYWWPSNKKLSSALPSSLQFIHNTALTWREATIGGTRLWDTAEFSFDAYMPAHSNPPARSSEPIDLEQQEKIYQRELQRLKASLDQLDSKATHRIAMTHYPPIGADLKPSRTAALLEQYQIDVCVFGHLHNIDPITSVFGEKNGVRYVFASADYLGFKPIKLFPS